MRSYFAIVSLLVAVNVYGWNDSDLDGVEDAYDQCPQTPFSDLVDLDGCTVLKTDTSVHYNIIGGIGYSKINYASQEAGDTTTFSLETNLFYDRWQLQGILAYYLSDASSTEQSGMDDSTVNLIYHWAVTERLSVSPGLGVILPTYETGYHNEATDYRATLNLEYRINPDLYGFGGYGYRWVNDTDTAYERYQNAQSYYAGLGYRDRDNDSWSLNYSHDDTIFRNNGSAESLGIRFYRELTPHWFIDVAYDYGLTEAAGKHTVLTRLGFTM